MFLTWAAMTVSVGSRGGFWSVGVRGSGLPSGRALDGAMLVTPLAMDPRDVERESTPPPRIVETSSSGFMSLIEEMELR